MRLGRFTGGVALLLSLALVACGADEERESGRVAGNGMAPALVEGDEFEYEPADSVEVGDIVAFEFADQPGQVRMFIKRVVALSGQTVEVADGVVLVDGAPLDESGYEASAPSFSVPQIEVPEGHMYVLGDNDSADFGPVPLDAVHGVVVD